MTNLLYLKIFSMSKKGNVILLVDDDEAVNYFNKKLTVWKKCKFSIIKENKVKRR